MLLKKEPRWLSIFRIFLSLAPMVLEIVTPVLERSDILALAEEKKELEAKILRDRENSKL